jgi:phosphohistidine phosphatase SixA
LTVALLLVRHGSAGSRSRWQQDDRLRPLDKRGRRQAEGLVDALSGYPIDRIVTSPYARCVQTVQPLALRVGIEIEKREELAEGSGPLGVLGLIHEVAGNTSILCSHGDVILDLIGWERKASKGSTWILELDGDRFAPAVYLPPAG